MKLLVLLALMIFSPFSKLYLHTIFCLPKNNKHLCLIVKKKLKHEPTIFSCWRGILSLTDEYCNSNNVIKEEKLLCYKTSLLFCEMLKDLEKKNFLRPNITAKNGQKHFLNVMWNVQKISNAFNVWFDIYVDRRKPDSKQKLKRIMEIGDIAEEEALYLLFSQMIFVFLQNIEELRSALLYVLKLPILVPNERTINKKTTLNQLFLGLKNLGIKNADTLANQIEGDLRNGLSHSLFWFEMKDNDCSELHLHYSEDVEFSTISSPISITELFLKTRKQSLITNCLLNVIADWFENTI